jgi:hypothetical protein
MLIADCWLLETPARKERFQAGKQEKAPVGFEFFTFSHNPGGK